MALFSRQQHVLDSHVDARGATVVVREATESDAGRMVRLMQRLLEETPYMLRLPEEQRDHPSDEARYIRATRASGNSVILIADVDDQTAGVVVVTGGGLLRVSHVGYLGMGVLREHWGRGLGKALLDASIAWAQGHPLIRRLSLQVYANNERAIALYRHSGFLEEGRLVGEVNVDGEFIDMLQMALPTVSDE